MMLSRRVPQPPPDPAARIALAAAVDQVLALCRDAVRQHAGNKDLCDLALDIVNTLIIPPTPDAPESHDR